MSGPSDHITPSRLRNSASVPSFHSPTKGPLPSSSTPLSSITQHAESPKRPTTPSQYLSSPIKHPANAHPYAIHSSSTSILTRTNSSPSKVIEPGRYRPSRSMSSLHYIIGDTTNTPSQSEAEEDKETDVAVRRRAGLKKSSSIASFTLEKDNKAERPELPFNPKTWSPNDLAMYLGWILRTGGLDASGETLPERLIDDIRSWIYRHRISGREFLNVNSDIWSASQPPPFLSLLLTLSRKLRRESIQGTSFHRGEASVFQEDEEDAAGYSEAPLRGVKGLAKSYEVLAGESPVPTGEVKHLEPQWTGSSTSSAVWERWGIKRHHTGTSIDSALSTEDDRGIAETSTVIPVFDKAATSAAGQETLGKSPPPPYASPFLQSGLTAQLHQDNPQASVNATFVINATLAGEASPPQVLSAEPEPPRNIERESSFGKHSGADHIRDQLESYKTLRASDHPPPGLGTSNVGERHAENEDAEESGTARRVTLRPLTSRQATNVRGVFVSDNADQSSTDFGPNWRSSEQTSLEQKLEDICRRLSYLEQQNRAHTPLNRSLWTSWSIWTSVWGNEGIDEAIQRLRDGDVAILSSVAGVLLFTGIGLGMIAGGVLNRRR